MVRAGSSAGGAEGEKFLIQGLELQVAAGDHTLIKGQNGVRRSRQC